MATANSFSHAVLRASVWSGPLFIAFFFGAVLLCGWIPAPPPDQAAEAVVAMYRENLDRIRMGSVLLAAAGFWQGIWAGVMSTQLRRIEGENRLWTYTQLAAGGVGLLVVIIPAFAFATAAYDLDRHPDITQMLHQFGWLTLVGIGWSIILQAIAVGVAVLCDPRPQPLFPRWFGWWNLWVAFGLLPGPFVVFFNVGAFAWNGLAVFWLPANVFFLWYASWFWMLRKSTNQPEEAL